LSGLGTKNRKSEIGNPKSDEPSFAQILLLTSWKDRALFAASQAGMINNLNDGMVWGLVPIFLARVANIPAASKISLTSCKQ
jgi:hypothetical protein